MHNIPEFKTELFSELLMLTHSYSLKILDLTTFGSCYFLKRGSSDSFTVAGHGNRDANNESTPYVLSM